MSGDNVLRPDFGGQTPEEPVVGCFRSGSWLVTGRQVPADDAVWTIEHIPTGASLIVRQMGDLSSAEAQDALDALWECLATAPKGAA